MRILLVGATGFVGSVLARALLEDGHKISGFGRDFAQASRMLTGVDWIVGDLRTMTTAQSWSPHTRGVDLVINASGALQNGLRDDVVTVQRDAIAALADAAQDAGAGHFIQISAAGADETAVSPFMTSKAEADAAIERSGVRFTIVRPGLVIGRNAFGGTELIRTVAALPFVAIQPRGAGPIQSIAMDDLVAAVRRVVADPAAFVGRFDLVERDARSLGEIIDLHRAWLGIAKPRWRIGITVGTMRAVAWVADVLGWLGWRSPMRSNAIAALALGVRGNVDQSAALLGRVPCGLPEALAKLGIAGKADRWHSRLASIYPLALIALAAVWIASGVLGLLRIDHATALLRAGGIDAWPSTVLVGAGSIADIAIGAGIAFRPTLSVALKAGIVLSLAYLCGSVAIRPDLWFDPLGAMLKVVPMIVLMLACLAMAGER